MKKLLAVQFILLAYVVVTFSQVQETPLSKAVGTFVTAYNAQDYKEFSALLDPEAAKQLTPELLSRFLGAHMKEYGKVTETGREQVLTPEASIFPLKFERGEFNLAISMNLSGKVTGFRITPLPPKTFESNTVPMRLPFEGEWFVFWGGDSAAENYHQDHPNQRFAFDFLRIDESGKTHTGDGTKNEDYYAFGQKIVAPADGVVTDVVTGVRDNIPGEMNPLMALGNNVVIRHADGEYSVYAHFKQNSIVVKVGQSVRTGDLLGLCGNSGNTSEAHLHFQIQKNTFFENEGSKKTFFEDLLVGPKGSRSIETRYSPKKGDIVMNDLKPHPSEIVPKK